MRTRFLTPNYFTTSQTLDFLRLQLSPISSTTTGSTATIDELCGELLHSAAVLISSAAVSLELENLPVDDALSKFYSDVLPHTIDVDHDGFPVNSVFDSANVQVSGKRANLCCTDTTTQSCLTSHSESLNDQLSEESKDDTGGDKILNEPVILQFEIPELSQYVENACMSEKESALILSEVQANDDLEMPDLVPVDAKDSVISVDTICLEYDIAQKLQIPEDVDMSPKKDNPCAAMFPLLEVDETGPADFTRFCVEDEWHSLLVTMGEHPSEYPDDIGLRCQNLLVSMKIDILELISHGHPSEITNSCFTSLNLSVNADFLQLLEAPNLESKIGVEYSLPIVVAHQFEEFEMLDSNTFDIFEALAIFQTAKEPKACDQLFHSNQHFKSFDELIVSSELAIIDGTFTSMPVPILDDDEKTWSIEIIFDAVLAELEQLPFSTSDEIYLDWHLLGDNTCNGHVNAATEKVFSDVEDYKIEVNLESRDCGTIVLDFLLSEYPLDEVDTTENKLEILPVGSCAGKQQVNLTATKRWLDNDCQFIENGAKIPKVEIDKVASSNLSDDDDCQIIEKHQLAREGDLGEVTSSFGSMPQVNDLDFFLNPRKASASMKMDQMVKPQVAKIMLSGGLYKRAVAAVPSCPIQLDGHLNFGLLTESLNAASPEAPARKICDSLPVPVSRTAQEPPVVLSCESSFPDMVIIVNTEYSDEEMIISRRGTYQKILGMEKRGVQVVERDLMMPIDIILDAVTCIVWYDSNNIGKKATAEDEGSSSVPLCIENIATNVLTSLSFTFTTCVLVFEGDSHFLGTVMESADGLYAAAASLGINIQIFCSYSSELTDEIILNCFGQARKFCNGSLPSLPETESHVESFLTKVPSINPLSAHAIISCGCVLLKYLEWSSDSRIHALRKYNLSEESVNLLSVLFKYGEREEVKSGLTDCSSSVSSPPDSEKIVRKVNSVDKKRKYIPNSSDAIHNLRYSTASDKCIDDGLDYFESPSTSKASKNPRISHENELPDFFFDDELFGDRARSDTGPNMGPSKTWPESNVPRKLKVSQFREDTVISTLPVNDAFGEQNMARANEIQRDVCTRGILQDLHEDFEGEVVNIYDKSQFGKDFQLAETANMSSPVDCEAHASRNSEVGRKLLFDSSSYLNFPMVNETSTGFGLENNRQFRADNDYNGVAYNWDCNSFNPQQEQTGTGLFEKSMKSFRGSLSKEKFVPSHGETPLSKAVHSTQLQQGSPWTIEFLNRIKEKRRMRQQNQPWDTSIPQSANHVNVSKNTKRRSPSILEYYKYQGGAHDSTPRKLTPKRLQKKPGQMSNEKPTGLRPSLTPIDKRARRSLSFVTGGVGGQTRLIWNDNISYSQDNRFSN